MPMTGFSLWDANIHTNGFGLWNLTVTPSGQLLISVTPIKLTVSNGATLINAVTVTTTNALPVFY